jgi:hypothetical protein
MRRNLFQPVGNFQISTLPSKLDRFLNCLSCGRGIGMTHCSSPDWGAVNIALDLHSGKGGALVSNQTISNVT